MTASARARIGPVSAFMVRSSLISSPSKPISPRMMSRVTIGRRAGRRAGIDVAEDDVRRHRRRHVIERLERREVRRRQLGAALGDDGQRQMAVGGGAAVSGNVLDHRHDAAGHEALADRLGERDHLLDAAPVGAIADDVVRARHRHVEHRRAVGIDAEFGEIGGEQARRLEGGGQRRLADRPRRAGHKRRPAAERGPSGGRRRCTRPPS